MYLNNSIVMFSTLCHSLLLGSIHAMSGRSTPWKFMYLAQVLVGLEEVTKFVT